ncbi:uncharacterized protein JCM10292_002624 [Rhodotorula paludigena]|uniref:uncharacterized protein n=1 Tax=Rhodotorula paludigena TaxID=86838 RepID=UPI00316F5333
MLRVQSLWITLVLFTAQTSTSQAPASTDLSSGPAASPTTSGSVTGTESVPFFSAPNTFTPTASGVSPAPGSVVTIVNTAGAGSYTDTFVYTAAASTVPPTGNITNTAVPARSGGAGGVTDLSPNPTHLQFAAAPPSLLPTASSFLPVALSLSLALISGLYGVLV